MRKPNFFIMGAPKCGTTSLFHYLGEHPAVFVPRIKEPHYFAVDLPGFPQVHDEGSYLALFTAATGQHEALGEASVWYLFSKLASQRIRAFAPESRLIVMFRNPVDFVQSIHSQFSYNDIKTPDFVTEWRNQTSQGGQGRLMEYGLFGEQYERLLTVFPQAQVLPILLEDFRADPRGQYSKVLRFLELEDDGRVDFPTHNANRRHRSHRVAMFARETPKPVVNAWNRTKRLIGLRGLGLMDRVIKVNTRRVRRTPLDSALREEVRDSFSEDIRKLARLLDRDLSHWT